MLGFIGLSASVTYVRAALMSPGGDSRSWLIAVVWAVFGGLWIVFALLGRARSR